MMRLLPLEEIERLDRGVHWGGEWVIGVCLFSHNFKEMFKD